MSLSSWSCAGAHWGGGRGESDRASYPHHLGKQAAPEMGYRACLAFCRLAKTYSNPRLEAACRRALEAQACSYQSLKSILNEGWIGNLASPGSGALEPAA